MHEVSKGFSETTQDTLDVVPSAIRLCVALPSKLCRIVHKLLLLYCGGGGGGAGVKGG